MVKTTVNEAYGALSQSGADESLLEALTKIDASKSPSSFPADVKDALKSLGAMTRLEEAWKQVEDEKVAVDSAKKDFDTAYTALQSSRSEYYNYTASVNGNSAKKEELSVKYQAMYQQYSTEYSKLSSLEQTVFQLQNQIVNDQMSVDAQNLSYDAQFDALKTATLDAMQKELNKLEKSMAKTTVVAHKDGIVTDILVSEGTMIGQGTEVAQLTPAKKESSVITCYVPVSDGRKITVGMEVKVYPTTVNRQEYGHMKATVVEVDDYITSSSTMKNFLGDSNLVQAFTQKGPVIAVTCELQKDDSTVSGYAWSSQKGSNVEIKEGTLVYVDVVTESKRPIDMLIPFLKDTFSVEKNDEDGGKS